jgi:hypothetical protein
MSSKLLGCPHDRFTAVSFNFVMSRNFRGGGGGGGSGLCYATIRIPEDSDEGCSPPAPMVGPASASRGRAMRRRIERGVMRRHWRGSRDLYRPLRATPSARAWLDLANDGACCSCLAVHLVRASLRAAESGGALRGRPERGSTVRLSWSVPPTPFRSRWRIVQYVDHGGRAKLAVGL